MSLHRILVCAIALAVVSRISCNLNGLKEEFRFKRLDFAYDDNSEKDEDVKSGVFNDNMGPLDVDVDYTNVERRVFLTIPRSRRPSPATLATISSKNSSVIVPYPSWSWHRDWNSCNTERMVSVHRIKIDRCGRLWVLDTGKYDNNQTCPPQLIAFNLKTDKAIYNMDIPKEMYNERTLFSTPVIEIRKTCENIFVYMADTEGFALIVRDVKYDKIWKITDRSFNPDPLFGQFNIAGTKFEAMDGISGMDVTPYKPNQTKQERKLFYSSLSGGTGYWVYLYQIRNHTIFSSPSNLPRAFHKLVSDRWTQSSAMAIDKNGVAFFGLMSDLSLNCWNTGNTEYGQNIDTIAQDSEKLQFASGVKIVANKEGEEELWFITSRIQKVKTKTLNISDTNFRIFSGNPKKLVQGKRCERAFSPIRDPQI